MALRHFLDIPKLVATTVVCFVVICNVLGQNPLIVFEQPINEFEGGGITDLGNGDWFGYAVASIGDINQDGFMDLAVGAPYDDDGGSNKGALYILFMDASAQVGSYQKISAIAGGFQGNLVEESFFGSEITNIGDLDGNGVEDLVIGASGDDDIGGWAGALWVLFMNSDGTVLTEQKISASVGWSGSPLGTSDRFGKGLDSIGDINGDGVIDIMAGVHEDDDGGNNHGAAYVLFLNANGTVQSHVKISEITPGFNSTLTNNAGLGWSIACLGDLDNNGTTEVLVSAPFDDVLAVDDGRVYIMSISSTGNLVSNTEISAAVSPILAAEISAGDKFGSAVSRGFSMWCDDAADIAVGSMNYGSPSVGGVLLIDLNSFFEVQAVQVITEGQTNFQDNLNSGDKFGRALDLVTDYDGNGYPDLFVGDMVFGSSGGTWLLSLGPAEAPSVFSDSIQLCENSSFQLFPAIPVDDILWSTGATSDTILVQQSGTVWIEGVAAGCTINDTINVIISPIPELSLGNDTLVCDSLLLNTSESNYQTNWSTGAQLQSISVSESGTYWVTIDGVCGVFSDTIHIEIPEDLSFSLGADTIICEGNNLLLQPTLFSGNADVFEWYNGSSLEQNTVSIEGDFWLTISEQCSIETDTIHVDLGYNPVISIPADTLVCATSIDILAEAETYGSYTATWSTGDVGLSATIDSSGTYVLTLNDICGSATDSIEVSMLNAVFIQLPNDTTICDGDVIDLTPDASWFGILDFLWSSGSGDTTITAMAAGEYWIEAVTNCGSISDTMLLFTSGGPYFSLGSDTVLCAENLEIQPQGSFIGEVEYDWSSNEITNTITVDTSGLYILEATDACGSFLDTIHVELIQGDVNINLPDYAFVCTGDSILLTAEVSNLNAQVFWSTGEIGESITVSNSYWYSASVSEQCGGDADTTYVYRVDNEPIYTSLANLACGSATILKIDSVRQYSDWLAPLQPAYLWSTGSNDTIITVSESGDYWLEQTGYCGVDSAFFSVELDDCWSSSVPNVITPNGDGLNDIFVPFSVECSSCAYRLRVYNRWGIQVFDEVNTPWDGILKTNRPSVSGVYFYILNVGETTHTGYLEVLP